MGEYNDISISELLDNVVQTQSQPSNFDMHFMESSNPQFPSNHDSSWPLSGENFVSPQTNSQILSHDKNTSFPMLSGDSTLLSESIVGTSSSLSYNHSSQVSYSSRSMQAALLSSNNSDTLVNQSVTSHHQTPQNTIHQGFADNNSMFFSPATNAELGVCSQECSNCEILSKKLKNANVWKKFLHEKLQDLNQVSSDVCSYKELERAYENRTIELKVRQDQLMILLQEAQPMREKLSIKSSELKKMQEELDRVSSTTASLELLNEQLKARMEKLNMNSNPKNLEETEKRLYRKTQENKRFKTDLENKSKEVHDLKAYISDHKVYYERQGKKSLWAMQLVRRLERNLTSPGYARHGLTNEEKDRFECVFEETKDALYSQYKVFRREKEKLSSRMEMNYLPSLEEWMDDFDKNAESVWVSNEILDEESLKENVPQADSNGLISNSTPKSESKKKSEQKKIQKKDQKPKPAKPRVSKPRGSYKSKNSEEEEIELGGKMIEKLMMACSSNDEKSSPVKPSRRYSSGSQTRRSSIAPPRRSSVIPNLQNMKQEASSSEDEFVDCDDRTPKIQQSATSRSHNSKTKSRTTTSYKWKVTDSKESVAKNSKKSVAYNSKKSFAETQNKSQESAGKSILFDSELESDTETIGNKPELPKQISSDGISRYDSTHSNRKGSSIHGVAKHSRVFDREVMSSQNKRYGDRKKPASTQFVKLGGNGRNETPKVDIKSISTKLMKESFDNKNRLLSQSKPTTSINKQKSISDVRYKGTPDIKHKSITVEPSPSVETPVIKRMRSLSESSTEDVSVGNKKPTDRNEFIYSPSKQKLLKDDLAISSSESESEESNSDGNNLSANFADDDPSEADHHSSLDLSKKVSNISNEATNLKLSQLNRSKEETSQVSLQDDKDSEKFLSVSIEKSEISSLERLLDVSKGSIVSENEQLNETSEISHTSQHQSTPCKSESVEIIEASPVEYSKSVPVLKSPEEDTTTLVVKSTLICERSVANLYDSDIDSPKLNLDTKRQNIETATVQSDLCNELPVQKNQQFANDSLKKEIDESVVPKNSKKETSTKSRENGSSSETLVPSRATKSRSKNLSTSSTSDSSITDRSDARLGNELNKPVISHQKRVRSDSFISDSLDLSTNSIDDATDKSQTEPDKKKIKTIFDELNSMPNTIESFDESFEQILGSSDFKNFSPSSESKKIRRRSTRSSSNSSVQPSTAPIDKAATPKKVPYASFIQFVQGESLPATVHPKTNVQDGEKSINEKVVQTEESVPVQKTDAPAEDVNIKKTLSDPPKNKLQSRRDLMMKRANSVSLMKKIVIDPESDPTRRISRRRRHMGSYPTSSAAPKDVKPMEIEDTHNSVNISEGNTKVKEIDSTIAGEVSVISTETKSDCTSVATKDLSIAGNLADSKISVDEMFEEKELVLDIEVEMSEESDTPNEEENALEVGKIVEQVPIEDSKVDSEDKIENNIHSENLKSSDPSPSVDASKIIPTHFDLFGDDDLSSSDKETDESTFHKRKLCELIPKTSSKKPNLEKSQEAKNSTDSFRVRGSKGSILDDIISLDKKSSPTKSMLSPVSSQKPATIGKTLTPSQLMELSRRKVGANITRLAPNVHTKKSVIPPPIMGLPSKKLSRNTVVQRAIRRLKSGRIAKKKPVKEKESSEHKMTSKATGKAQQTYKSKAYISFSDSDDSDCVSPVKRSPLKKGLVLDSDSETEVDKIDEKVNNGKQLESANEHVNDVSIKECENNISKVSADVDESDSATSKPGASEVHFDEMKSSDAEKESADVEKVHTNNTESSVNGKSADLTKIISRFSRKIIPKKKTAILLENKSTIPYKKPILRNSVNIDNPPTIQYPSIETDVPCTDYRPEPLPVDETTQDIEINQIGKDSNPFKESQAKRPSVSEYEGDVLVMNMDEMVEECVPELDKTEDEVKAVDLNTCRVTRRKSREMNVLNRSELPSCSNVPANNTKTLIETKPTPFFFRDCLSENPENNLENEFVEEELPCWASSVEEPKEEESIEKESTEKESIVDESFEIEVEKIEIPTQKIPVHLISGHQDLYKKFLEIMIDVPKSKPGDRVCKTAMNNIVSELSTQLSRKDCDPLALVLAPLCRSFIQLLLKCDPFEDFKSEDKVSQFLSPQIYSLFMFMKSLEVNLSNMFGFETRFLDSALAQFCFSLMKNSSSSDTAAASVLGLQKPAVLNYSSLACLSAWHTSACNNKTNKMYQWEQCRCFLMEMLCLHVGSVHAALLSSLFLGKWVFLRHVKYRKQTGLERALLWVAHHGPFVGREAIRASLIKGLELKYACTEVPPKEPLMIIEQLISELITDSNGAKKKTAQLSDTRDSTSTTVCGVVVLSLWMGRSWTEEELLPTVVTVLATKRTVEREKLTHFVSQLIEPLLTRHNYTKDNLCDLLQKIEEADTPLSPNKYTRTSKAKPDKSLQLVLENSLCDVLRKRQHVIE